MSQVFRWLKSLGLFALVIASVLIGVLLFLHNDQVIALDLILFSTPPAAIAVWLMVFFFVGLAVGASVSIVAYLWIRGRTWGLRRKVRKLEDQVASKVSSETVGDSNKNSSASLTSQV